MGRFGAPFFILPAPFFNKLPFSILPPLLTVAWIYGKIKKVMNMDEKKELTIEEDSVKTKDIIKASLKNMFKNHKKLFKAVIALVVVLAVLAAGAIALSSANVQLALMNAMVPDEITHEKLGITFYSEPNPEYDGERAVLPYICYYYENNDTSGEKIYLNNGVYNNGASKVYVAAGFGLASLPTIRSIGTAFDIAAAVVAVAIVILLIYAWYRSFKKQELAKKEAYRKSHPRH